MIISLVIIFLTGLTKFIYVWLKVEAISNLSSNLSVLHDLTGVILGILVIAHVILHRKWLIAMTRNLMKIAKWDKKTLNYFIDLGMFISFFLLFITGLIKFPSVLVSNPLFIKYSNELLVIHDWSGIILTILVFLHITLHWRWIAKTTKRVIQRVSRRKALKVLIIGSFLVFFTFSITFLNINLNDYSSSSNERIQIAGVGWPTYNPDQITTIRSDLFQDGHFSIFDILVNLDISNEIDMKYHFVADMDTYVIDSINDEENLWYTAYYEGGWEEDNVFRMDHYPYKPNMEIRIERVSSGFLESIYTTFREEINRLTSNNGKTIIPNVIITSPHNDLSFQNVEVTAHNLRDDKIQEGVITAIDVIMSLGDQGLITYEINWYETIGRSVVRNYYVDGISEDLAYARCGFVYEAGDLDFQGFRGNHIHIPSDIRIINSPEYEEWFWICL